MIKILNEWNNLALPKNYKAPPKYDIEELNKALQK